MFSSKQKTIKSMFSSDIFKNVEKIISNFFFNEGIRRSEESRGTREADDDGGEDVRVLSSISSDDENGDDNDDGDGSDEGDGGGGDDDNNGGNNSADGELIILKIICNC